MSKLGCRFFIDMDGVVAKFNTVKSEEQLYKKGYFKNLPPQENILKAVKELAKVQDQESVYILSCYLKESRFALDEKKEWLKKYLPEISENQWIFVPCGERKTNYVPWGVGVFDILVDDYGANIRAWKEANENASYIKVCDDFADMTSKEKTNEDERGYFTCEDAGGPMFIYDKFVNAAREINKEFAIDSSRGR